MKLRRAFRQGAWILCATFIVTACEPPTTAPTTGDISGTILDASSSQPISGATITTDPITSSKTTDSEGAFTIEGVEPGTYTVQASKTSYHTNTTIVSIVAGETASADIQLTPQGPELAVSTTLLNFGTSSTNLTFNISNTGVGTLTWNIISNANWVTVNPANGSTETETDVVTVTVNRTGMSYGNHYETITVTSNTNSKTIDLVMTIPNPTQPQLSVSPITLDFGASETRMSLYITNTGTGMLTWNITDDKAWISADPQSGTTETETDEIVVTLDRLGHSPGTYTGTITVSSDGGNENITVTMTVPDEPTLSITPTSLDFGSSETTLSFDVANAGSGDLTWSVTDNQGWITTHPISGTNYGSVNVSVSRNGLSTGDYSGTVTISSNGGTGGVAVLMNVPADLPPTAVQLYEPTNITSSAMTLSWEMSTETDFLSYKLYRGADATVDENSTLITTISNRYTTEHTDGNLQDGATYYYRLFVEDAIHQTTGSNVVNGTTLTEPGVWGSFATLAVDLKWISALNSNFVYTVGDSGKIYKWDGTSWTEEQSPTTEWLGGVTIIAENDVWISGEEGVWHYNGAFWVQEAEYPTTACYGIDHVSADSVWVAGVGKIHFYNGTAWSTSSVGSGYTGYKIMDISMNSPSDGWAISSAGEVFHYNGFSWAPVYDFSGWSSYSVANSVWRTNSSNLWVAGYMIRPPSGDYYNDVWYWNGSTWTSYDTYYVYIYDVEGTSGTNVWFAGNNGHIYHWNGIEFSEMNSPTTEDIMKIHFIDSSDGWAVGDGGVILRYH